MATRTRTTPAIPHTPGPWAVNNDVPGDDTIGIVAADGTIVTAVWPIEAQYAGDDAESYANARLILAAPDLLAVLMEVERVERDGTYALDTEGRAMLPSSVGLAVRAAIAKAKGL